MGCCQENWTLSELEAHWSKVIEGLVAMSEVYAFETRRLLHGAAGPRNQPEPIGFLHAECEPSCAAAPELRIVFAAHLTMLNVMECGAKGMARRCHDMTTRYPGPRAVLVRPHDGGMLIVGFASM